MHVNRTHPTPLQISRVMVVAFRQLYQCRYKNPEPVILSMKLMIHSNLIIYQCHMMSELFYFLASLIVHMTLHMEHSTNLVNLCSN